MKTATYKRQLLTARSSASRRKRIEREAIEMLDGAGLSPARKRNAVARIRSAQKPRVEAQRIVAQARKDAMRGIVETDAIDLSDTQELRVRLYRRDGGIWSPHSELLARMDRAIAAGRMHRPEFEKMAGAVLSMKLALPRPAIGGKAAIND